MWVRLKLDFGWRDFFHGVTRLLLPFDRSVLADAITERWTPNAFPVLSVRSGFDLFLGTVGWPAGSEIVCSALNIPGMTMIMHQHGLVPVPADLDIDRLAPNLELLEKAITPRTKALLIAHLYGNFVPLEPIVDIARRHNLMVIEDAAEIYDGVYTGHPDADVSLFSFGPLKTATALAGGMLRIKDPQLLAAAKAKHAEWPVQGRYDYLCRLTKYGTLRFFGAPWIYGVSRKAARLAVGDVDGLIQHSAKSFLDEKVMHMLRQQPSGPLLAAMARRLANFDHARLQQRTANGKLLTELLRGQVACPAAELEPHNYWLFPVLVSDRAKSIAALADAGFDATVVTSMRSIDAPADRPELAPTRTADALEHLILVPNWPGIPEAELRRMADVLIAVERQASRVEALKVTVQPAETTYPENRVAEPALNVESAAPR
ncbi:MAG TPA: DegT/DnrJ/EryC1/StrS family aminotransferase [Gemmataceae bacterium]|nr:DegT/DnrJ/EryC1/StrS family aminotransferase [Gemmataceae bacterium]